MKIISSISRAIANPLGAAVICLVGGCAIWFAQTPPGGAAKLNASGEQATGQRPSKVDRSDQGQRRKATASKADDRQRTRNQRGAIAANKRGDSPRESAVDRNDIHSKEFEAENEPLNASVKTTAPNMPDSRSKMTKTETTTEPASDVIGPSDPRAPALSEYQTKKTQVFNTVADQKRLALWCDERGLWDLAKAHWEASVRLDSKSDEARRRLGYRSKGGNWIVDVASAEDVA